MKRKDIEEKMGDTNKWDAGNGVVFSREKPDGQIDVVVDGYNFTMFAHQSDPKDFYLQTSNTELYLFGNVVRAYQKLASIVEYQLEGMPTAITVEKQVEVAREVESVESARKISQLEGTVYAYEKMLINREVTISR